MEKWLIHSYAKMLCAGLMAAITIKDIEWIKNIENDLKRSKHAVKKEFYKLIDDPTKLTEFNDSESMALLLDFMNRHKLINKNEMEIGL